MNFCKWSVIFLLVLVVGCASVRTTVTNPEGEVYIVHSKKDALVSLKEGDTELTVDNRGKIGILENLMGILLMKTDINLRNEEE